MAQDSDLPKPATAADKGKGKAVDEVKDDKAVADGKKEDDKKDGKYPTPLGDARYPVVFSAMADLRGNSCRRGAQ